MSDELSFVEVEGQQVELLPARTVLSLFATGATGAADTSGAAGGGAAYTGGAGGDGSGKAAFFNPVFYVEGDVTNALTGGAGGTGGAVGGGAATPATTAAGG